MVRQPCASDPYFERSRGARFLGALTALALRRDPGRALSRPRSIFAAGRVSTSSTRSMYASAAVL